MIFIQILAIFMVYVFKVIPAKFREKIMIATALGNSCNHWLAAVLNVC